MADKRRLTLTLIRELELPKSGRLVVHGTEQLGLQLHVYPGGRKVYYVRYRTAGGRGGQSRRYQIGQHGAGWTLDSARREARRILGLVADGQDPQAARNRSQQRAGRTLSDILHEYETRHLSTLRSGAQVRRTLALDLEPLVGHLTPDRIDVQALRQVLARLEDRPGTRRKMRAHLSHLWQWMLERGLCEANPIDRLPRIKPGASRDRILSLRELREVLGAARALGDPWWALIELLVLTGQRRTEVAGMRWAELDGARWSFNAERAKNGRAQVLDLPAEVMAVVDRCRERLGPDDTPFVITSHGDAPVSGFSRAKSKLDEAILTCRRNRAVEAGIDPDAITAPPPWVLHDLRRSAASGMVALGVRESVVEAVLNHVSGSRGGVAGVYNRHHYGPEKAEALAQWAAVVMP